jgi:uncharacterized protein with GYD domain
MAYYLMQAAYTSEAWLNMVESPQDRLAAVEQAVKSLGGRLIGGWLTFGKYDVVIVLEMPDNVSAAAFSIATMAGGALRKAKTTPMMTFEDGVEAMKKEAAVRYRPPSK